MDGVLVDSNRFHRDAWYELARRHALSLSERDLERHVFGHRTGEAMHALWGERFGAVALRRMVDEKERLYRRAIATELTPLPGLPDLLGWLQGAGVPLGLASSAEAANVAQVLRGLGLGRVFRARVLARDVRRAKPHPAIFERAAERLGVPRARCVVFEDSLAGVEAAGRAGMACIGVTTTHTAAELVGAGVALAVRDFRGRSLRRRLARMLGLTSS